MKTRSMLPVIALSGLLVCGQPAADSDEGHTLDTMPRISIRQVMESIITPSTNALWGADNPQTDEQWQSLEDAAISVIGAGTLISLGGTGSEDNDWTRQPEWQAFVKIMTDAGLMALQAVRKRDIENLMQAGEILYPPCESCHMQFHPEMRGQP